MTLVAIALIAFCLYREWAWRTERRELLQRIQAPHQAIAQAAPRPTRRSPAPISADNDKRFKEEREERVSG